MFVLIPRVPHARDNEVISEFKIEYTSFRLLGAKITKAPPSNRLVEINIVQISYFILCASSSSFRSTLT